jgi:putative PEP-CTERM system histidine kinase
MLTHVTAISHLIGVGAYILAIILILASRSQHRYKILVLTAASMTAVWAAMVVAASFVPTSPLTLHLGITILEQLRSAAWIALIAFVLSHAYGKRDLGGAAIAVSAVISLAIIYCIAVPVLSAVGVAMPALAMRGVYLAHVVIAVVALLLIENLFRNSGREARWSVKYLCFGLGVIFAYDFFVYAQAALLGQIDPHVYAARGVLQAVAVPLLIVSSARSRSWPIDVHISRNFVFHSATLFAAGTYLLVMAAAGYSFRIFDSAWGTVAQALFLAAALVVLAVVLSSGEVQARFKNFINQNFFSYKYDYRTEWLRFIDAISGSADDLEIPERVVQALANIIGSTGGKIWVRRDEDQIFRAVGAWNVNNAPADIPFDDAWLTALAECPDAIDVRRQAGKGVAAGKSTTQTPLPEWLAAYPQALIILPLLHGETLVGFVMLSEMRAPRPFDWEDLKLLKTAARQAASYIAEENAARALAQIRRFEDFNHRFAFIVHDVKNLAAQMTLILKNAERHGDNPEFQKDMLHTVGESVSRLRGMLEQLKNPRVIPLAPSSIDLVDLLQDVAADWKLQVPKLECDLPTGPIHILGHREQLRAVVGHLIQNAADATASEGMVSLELHIEGVKRSSTVHDNNTDGKCWAVITVADNGPGMDSKFVENQLFQPLRSAKLSGFGIGAFQARHVARDMGGRLDIESKTGSGTRVCVRLPYVPAPAGIDKWNAGRAQDKTTHMLRSA